MAGRPDSTAAELVDGTAVLDAIKDVRNDATPTDWSGGAPRQRARARRMAR